MRSFIYLLVFISFLSSCSSGKYYANYRKGGHASSNRDKAIEFKPAFIESVPTLEEKSNTDEGNVIQERMKTESVTVSPIKNKSLTESEMKSLQRNSVVKVKNEEKKSRKKNGKVRESNESNEQPLWLSILISCAGLSLIALSISKRFSISYSKAVLLTLLITVAVLLLLFGLCVAFFPF